MVRGRLEELWVEALRPLVQHLRHWSKASQVVLVCRRDQVGSEPPDRSHSCGWEVAERGGDGREAGRIAHRRNWVVLESFWECQLLRSRDDESSSDVANDAATLDVAGGLRSYG